MKKHIKDWYHKVKGRVNWLHEKCKQPVKDTSHDILDIPYQIVSHWFLDIVSNGFIITFIWNTWFGWQGWSNVPLLFANGFAVWMLCELIKQIKLAMKEQ